MREEDKRRRRHRHPRQTPTERAYVHEGCGGVTVVSGYDFSRMANPFAFVSQTYCAACGRFVGLGSVAWEDTDEPISAYRRRMRRKAPLSLKLCGWVFGPLVCGLVGAIVAGGLSRKNPGGAIVAGAVVGMAVGVGFLMPMLARWVWRIDYRGIP